MMLVGPMKKRLVTTVVVVVIVLTLIFGALGFVIVSAKNKEIAEWEAKLGEETKRLVFTENFPAGHIIDKGDLTEAVIKKESMPADSYSTTTMVNAANREEIYFITGTNYKPGESINTLELLAGRELKINVSAKTPLTAEMLTELDGMPSDDLRLEEFSMITLPSDLMIGDFIDVRLSFATGVNYSVLIGKKVENFTDNTIFLKLTEDEILTMGSAIVEAYMYEGAKLYATKYVDPSNQLYDYNKVDYVAKYKEAVEVLKEAKQAEKLQKVFERLQVENPEELARLEALKLEDEEKYKVEILSAYGEEIKVSTEEITVEEISKHIGLPEYGTDEIKVALEKDDKKTIEKYENKIVASRKTLEFTYPVNARVAQEIKNNPNILEEVKANFNVDELIEREVEKYFAELYITLEENESRVEEQYQKVIEKVKKDVETQKDERIKFLNSLATE